jgi:hypothetical protein
MKLFNQIWLAFKIMTRLKTLLIEKKTVCYLSLSIINTKFLKKF